MARGRRRRNRRRRRKFLMLDSYQLIDGGMQQLMTEAHSHDCSRTKANQLSAKARDANAKRLADAEGVTELFLSRVPCSVTAERLVALLLQTLSDNGYISLAEACANLNVGTDAKAYVLRCEIRPKLKYNHTVAFVTVCNREIAHALRDHSPPGTLGMGIKVKVSNRVVIPSGKAWRTGSDPGRTWWNIHSFQVGERSGEHCFSSFWVSNHSKESAEHAHVELSPVGGVLIVTLSKERAMLKAVKAQAMETGAKPTDFTTTFAKLRIEIAFRSFCDFPRVEKVHDSSDMQAVSFSISKAPLLFRSCDESEGTPRLYNWDFLVGGEEEIRWIRTVDPTRNCAFSRAKTLRIILHRNDVRSLCNRLHQLYLIESPKQMPVQITVSKEKRFPDQLNMFQVAAKLFNVPFSVRYAVACILSLGTVREAEIEWDFWHFLSNLTENDALYVLECMAYHLSSNDAYRNYNNPLKVLRNTMKVLNISGKQQNIHQKFDTDSFDSEDTDEHIMERYVDELRLDELNANLEQSGLEGDSFTQDSMVETPSRQQAYIRRLMYTPTRTIALKAELDLLNRVLRKFAEHKHRFLRVSFCDEDGSSVAFARSEDLFARVRAALRNGICVAGERFVFLAFSNSQLRDHSVWMYNETPSDSSNPPSARDIRAWMGDFSMIRIPGKYAARQGQAFSSSLGTLELGPDQEELIDDIKDSWGNYLFSDGIGIVSPNLAKAMTKKLRASANKVVPSAFQIRYGGAKGMLAVWSSKLLPRRPGIEISLRQSMKKFDSDHRVLEVVGVAKCQPLFLNRQIIMILSGLGVPDEPFEKLQGQFLSLLNRAMGEKGASAALHVLLSSGAFSEPDGRLRSCAPMLSAVPFFRSGLTCVDCEHLFNMMNAFRKRMIRGVLNRTRILLDRRQGFRAIGVLDELGVLQPEQIFCQVRDPVSGELRIMKGEVTVGRSPCLHPGDIQPVHAVDHVLLRHMVDVIVFPRRGDRPLPSMLSGGDLDGDVFFCIFEKSIAYPREPPYAPMNYEAAEPRKLDHDLKSCDVADFFVDYIRNDNLGQIANAHLIYADKEKKGIFSKKCLELASLHSTAVDFAKSGIRADFTRELAPKYQRGQYPDFMGKHRLVSYKSERILGKLFRACSIQRTNQSSSLSVFPNQNSVRVDEIIDSLPEDIELQKEAESLCSIYNIEMKRLMDQYGVQSEGEMVSGQVLSFLPRHAQIQGQQEYNSVLTRMNRQTNELRIQFRDKFFEGLGQRPGVDYTTDTHIKACAWYKACKKQAEKDRRSGETAFLSFPWVVSDVLLTVIRKGFQRDR